MDDIKAIEQDFLSIKYPSPGPRAQVGSGPRLDEGRKKECKLGEEGL